MILRRYIILALLFYAHSNTDANDVPSSNSRDRTPADYGTSDGQLPISKSTFSQPDAEKKCTSLIGKFCLFLSCMRNFLIGQEKIDDGHDHRPDPFNRFPD